MRGQFSKSVVDGLVQQLIFKVLPEHCGEVDYNEEACIE